MKKNRMEFAELEALCNRESCRFSDLFLVGEAAFVMEESEDRVLPSKWRPLLYADADQIAKLPEILRRLDAVEFPTQRALQEAVDYRSEYNRVFPDLRDELYEVLTRHSRERVAPDGGQYYLELDGCGEDEGLLLSCETREDLTALLAGEMQRVLKDFESALNWNVRVSEGNNESPFCIVYKDVIQQQG